MSNQNNSPTAFFTSNYSIDKARREALVWKRTEHVTQCDMNCAYRTPAMVSSTESHVFIACPNCKELTAHAKRK